MQRSAWPAHGGFSRTNNCKDFFQQKKQTLQDLTQSLNSAAVRCKLIAVGCKLIKQGSMNKYMHYFKASL